MKNEMSGLDKLNVVFREYFILAQLVGRINLLYECCGLRRLDTEDC